MSVSGTFVTLEPDILSYNLRLYLDHTKINFMNKSYVELNFNITGKNGLSSLVNQPIKIIVYKCSQNCNSCSSFDLGS